jgi:tRNA(Ile)-lysidine synthase
MASSRSSAPADLVAALAAAAARDLGDGGPIAVALSGGRDSVALLHALVALPTVHRAPLSAIHVHHGLSPHADAWAGFCVDLAATLRIPCVVRHVDVMRRPRASLEESARAARYRALAAAAADLGATTLALAHHADDQAETLLLQLLRGAGPAGLAAMPRVSQRAGVAWWRPLLDTPRVVIDAYLRAHALGYVDDDSNTSDRFRRNALRMDVVPALRKLAPGYPATLARSSALQADAALLLDDLAAHDAVTAFDGATLSRDALAGLPEARARNLLRWFLRQHGLRLPSFARLAAMLAQIGTTRADARVRIAHDGIELGLHAGRVHIHTPVPAPFALCWSGKEALSLPHGTLSFTERAVDSDAPALARAPLAKCTLVVRSRTGGERLALQPGGTPRALKSLLQASALPAWERAALPLLFCDDRLVAVPGIGIDAAFRAARGSAALAITWAPHAHAPFQREGPPQQPLD